jgi:hypothetical protein
MEQGYGDQPPADHQHRVSHQRGAAVDNQVDHQQKAENRGDDQRSGNDLAPMCRGSPSWKTVLIPFDRLLSLFLADSNSQRSAHAA